MLKHGQRFLFTRVHAAITWTRLRHLIYMNVSTSLDPHGSLAFNTHEF